MNVTSLLNTAAESASTGVEATPKLPSIHERKGSTDEDTAGCQSPAPAMSTGVSPATSACTPTLPEKLRLRRSSSSRPSNRNRTPWDAGGYSLPLALDSTKNLVHEGSGARNMWAGANISLLHKDQDPFMTLPVMSIPVSPDTMDVICSSPKSTSPRHKFSDSRSSFSSAYTNASSTNNSVSHSRISSLSTVSENQPLANLITDFSLLETGISDPCLGHLPHVNDANNANSANNSSSSDQPQLKLQQYKFTATEASFDGHDVQPASPTPVRSQHSLPLGVSREPSPRTRSPSDAMLISRPALAAGIPDGKGPESPISSRLHIPPTHMRSQSRSNLLEPSDSSTRCHKRAVSAPDFSSLTPSTSNPRFPTFGPIPEPTPSPSQHSETNAMEQGHGSGLSSPGPAGGQPVSVTSDRMPPQNVPPVRLTMPDSVVLNSPGSPTPSGFARHQPQLSVGSVDFASDEISTVGNTQTGINLPTVNFDLAPVCMYRGDCETGSQLRKAISHIFGRNKLCTRMIPTGVWVHYCRKHYQRTRYRNSGEYPQRQIGLVHEQVRRVQAWSDSNVQQCRGPVLKDWSLSVRKREQRRLDGKAATGKKRPFSDATAAVEEEDDIYDDDRSEMSGTAVPDWLVSRIGDGYSTAQIISMVDQLRSDIHEGRLQQIPDIEILPNIVTDSTKDDASSSTSAKKMYTKRRTVGAGLGGHRRSQSVNTSALRTNSFATARRSSQPTNFMPPSARIPPVGHLQAPTEKRQRVDGDNIAYHGHSNHAGIAERFEPSSQSISRWPPAFLSRSQLTHRPAFAGIRESQAEVQPGHYYSDDRQYGRGFGVESHHVGDLYLSHQQSETPVRGHHEAVVMRPYGSDEPAYEPRREHERHHSTSSATLSSSHTGAYGVLPAPNPQRFGGPSVAQQLEVSPYVLNPPTRRPGMHHRSQSEATSLYHMTATLHGRPTSSSGPQAPQFPPTRPGVQTLPSFGNAADTRPAATYSTAINAYTRDDNHDAHYWTPQHRQSLGGSSQSNIEHGSQAGHGGSNSSSRSNSRQRNYSIGGHVSYAEESRRSSVSTTQQIQGYGAGTTSPAGTSHRDDKFDNVQLPPLQNIQTTPHDGVADSPSTPRHSRHQSSPAIPRTRPLTMEVDEKH